MNAKPSEESMSARSMNARPTRAKNIAKRSGVKNIGKRSTAKLVVKNIGKRSTTKLVVKNTTRSTAPCRKRTVTTSRFAAKNIKTINRAANQKSTGTTTMTRTITSATVTATVAKFRYRRDPVGRAWYLNHSGDVATA